MYISSTANNKPLIYKCPGLTQSLHVPWRGRGLCTHPRSPLSAATAAPTWCQRVPGTSWGGGPWYSPRGGTAPAAGREPPLLGTAFQREYQYL